MRLALVALTLMALTPLTAAASGRISKSDYYKQILSAPTSGDEYTFQKTFHQGAQDISNRMFNPLAKVLGGRAPTLNFPSSVGGSGEFHASATPATNSINLDPEMVQWLLDRDNSFHSSSVNVLPHEFAHLRQTPQVLASVPDSEGGAQAFADLVTPIAAAAAGIHYDAGNFDGSYSDFVKAAQAKGRDWLTGTQFGHAPVAWP